MDASEQEVFFDTCDSFPEQLSEKGLLASTMPQCDYVLPPGPVTVLSADEQTVSLSIPLYPAGYMLQLDYSSGKHTGKMVMPDIVTVNVDGLNPGTEYTFSVRRIADDGRQSNASSQCVFTEPSPPVHTSVYQAGKDSLSLCWDPPAGEIEKYIVTCSRDKEIVKVMTTDSNDITVSELEPGVCYTLEVSTQIRNGTTSKPTVASARTQSQLKSLLEDLGLEQHYREKLSLSDILQIDKKFITDEPVKCDSDLPWYFLKKLMMVNVTARNVKYTSVCEANCDGKMVKLEELFDEQCSVFRMNPLDIITALFMCSDGFVQQEIALKMSMCQFSVPLLLPNCDTNRCTLMLWAMRDIIKKYRPKSLSAAKGFREERIVGSELPVISFVRLGECSLSKSETLNKILSNAQQYHDTFIHHDMECGDSPRRISNGLVEITWYLPCGNKNMDTFSEPLAVANLRGDVGTFETQFSFLCQTSAAVFVFFDTSDSECHLLTKQRQETQMFLVGNHQSKSSTKDALKKVAAKMGLTPTNILIKSKDMNNADFVKKLRETVSNVVNNSQKKMGIEQMADIAQRLGILVDEDNTECQTAMKNAQAITADIQNILQYKEDQLPLQGQIWKELTALEKEEFRLRKIGSEPVEIYKSNLQVEKNKLREKQNSCEISAAMTHFISAISTSRMERCYFLKWMKMNLDNLSRDKLSDLRDMYKKKTEKSANKEEIKDIDRQLSNSSLGIEHFFREMGQIYEASVCLPETNMLRKQLEHLPRLCAQLLLDGLPLELVDGDASNIPLTWVSDVLSQLNQLVSPKGKILVVTVLGVQSTGKSTLLNTMFGVQFAVSSGRCTRGAFMLLIKMGEQVRKDLNCDFMVIIDTEGLKSPELAQLDDSHEHDNELAALVVGLSDITIINIAMENLTEMKDIIQIVVHAFLRMKEVGKKTKCHFVHQNVSDVSAHEKNLRDRKLLLQQLNEMTQAAAKMEKKKENKSFTDVMEYNPETGNCYIPGLWNGNPPMAPVNAGYSEAVYELKKNILQILQNRESSANNILEFKEWMRSLWNAVKHENFIFSFRNSLVADAYMTLCTAYNKWEWEFKKEMYQWTTTADTKMSNFGKGEKEPRISDLKDFLSDLKSNACTVLSREEDKILKNLEQYFKQKEGHVYLVERYRQDFVSSAKILRREMENSVISQLTAGSDMRWGMIKVDKITENHTKVLEERVHGLIEECRGRNADMTDKELDDEFTKMWDKMVKELSYSEQKPKKVMETVSTHLIENLRKKGSHASQLLSERKLQDCGLEHFKYSAEGFMNFLKKTFNWILKGKEQAMELQNLADIIIMDCTAFVTEKVQRISDYHDNYIQEILHMVDEKLESHRDFKIPTEFEVSLKQHICGYAARQFQKMHDDFIRVNDPLRRLNQNKQRFCTDFKDVFHKRDQCQKKAEEFTDCGLKPAVEAFVKRSLGPDVIGEMMTMSQFSNRISCQYSILMDLLTKDRFQDYLKFICSYERYVKKWISEQIEEHFSNGSTMLEFEEKHLKSSIDGINKAINKAKTTESDNLKTFVENVCQEIDSKLVISHDALASFAILKSADQEQFATWLTGCVNKMGQTLTETFKNTNIQVKLKALDVKPENELFTKLIGCGRQCPFCEAPCEAGGKEHSEHWASIHRPHGLGRYRWVWTSKLTTDICSSSVSSDVHFSCAATNGEMHPYKDYKEIFPDWKIPPDASLEASDCWKYVMTKFNKEFAKEYNAKPADIPETWRNITQDQAKASLQESFNLK